MSVKMILAAGAIFTACVWARVFGLVPVRAVLDDPYGEYQAIQVKIESLLREPADSSAIRTVEILDTLAGVN